jgi:hypothetical protein
VQLKRQTYPAGDPFRYKVGALGLNIAAPAHLALAASRFKHTYRLEAASRARRQAWGHGCSAPQPTTWALGLRPSPCKVMSEKPIVGTNCITVGA